MFGFPLPIVVLAIALVASLASNAWQFHSYLGVRDERTEAIGQRDQARAAANACSESVDRLQTAAVAREADNAEQRALALAAAQGHQARAQQILSAPAAVPGDDCKSARIEIERYLAQRKKP